MRILINKTEYEILEVSPEYEELKLENKPNASCLGVHNAYKSTIFIDGTLNNGMFKRTLIHELTHAFIYHYAFNHVEESYYIKTISEESMCEFIASMGQDIIEIANDYMRYRGVIPNA